MATRTRQPVWISQSVAARQEGVSRQWINQLIKAGRLKCNGKREVRREDVHRLRAEELDPSRGRHKPRGKKKPQRKVSSGGSGFTAARTKREIAQAMLLELELRKKSGELVDALEVKREIATQVVLLREALLSIPERLGSLMAGEGDENRKRTLMDSEIRHALATFVGKLGA